LRFPVLERISSFLFSGFSPLLMILLALLSISLDPHGSAITRGFSLFSVKRPTRGSLASPFTGLPLPHFRGVFLPSIFITRASTQGDGPDALCFSYVPFFVVRPFKTRGL